MNRHAILSTTLLREQHTTNYKFVRASEVERTKRLADRFSDMQRKTSARERRRLRYKRYQ